VENHQNVITDQAIVTLVNDSQTGLIWGGSSIRGGGGTEPRAKTPVLFGWSPTNQKITKEITLPEGNREVASLCRVDRRLFLTCQPSNDLLVYDLDKDAIVHRVKLEASPVLARSLAFNPLDGQLYGLTNREIVRIDPESFAQAVVAVSPRPLTCGFALIGHDIFTGAGAHLLRYRLP
ncbi:MAG TPA: hypothetical protein VL860_09480, partial [Planctomycetota bacterium]|nr:hypothetical protein [Planctomycetota bacterium]